MPQLDIHYYPSQIFWLFFSFIILFLVVKFFYIPKIDNILYKRQKQIDDNNSRYLENMEQVKHIDNFCDDVLSNAKIDAFNIVNDGLLQIAGYKKQALEECNNFKESLDSEYRQKLKYLSKNEQEILNYIENIVDNYCYQLFRKDASFVIEDKDKMRQIIKINLLEKINCIRFENVF